MASVTAATIKEFPELDDDYVIVLVDDGQTREARVYSRKDILDNFEGTEAEKAALEKQLKENPDIGGQNKEKKCSGYCFGPYLCPVAA